MPVGELRERLKEALIDLDEEGVLWRPQATPS